MRQGASITFMTRIRLDRYKTKPIISARKVKDIAIA
jgi:hypothetical protein